jgi:serine/threonine-protein kinase
VGEVLAGRYRVVRLIGQGGMGAVYEAQHTTVGRRFAVKFLRPELSLRPDLLARFRREALTVGALESENIVSVVDCGEANDGLPYIVMELLAGEDLASFLGREAPLPVPRAVDLIVQVCRALETVHATGIVHRDLKPANLFLCTRGDGLDLVKVLDFGIVKLGLEGSDGGSPPSAITRPGSMIGTPFYMPPEQARGDQELDHRADIYALGVILFEALTAAKPHPGDSYNAVLYHILMHPPTPVDTLRPGLPRALAAVVHRALASLPGDRQASVAELARELAPFRIRNPVPFGTAQDDPTPAGPTPVRSKDVPTVATRPRWVSVAAALLFAVGVGTVLVMVAMNARAPARDLASGTGKPPSAVRVLSPPPPAVFREAPGGPTPARPAGPAVPAALSNITPAPSSVPSGKQRQAQPPLPRARTRSVPVPPSVRILQPPNGPATPRRPAFDRTDPYQ